MLATGLAGAGALAAAWHVAPQLSVGERLSRLRAPLDRHELWSDAYRLTEWLVRAPRSAIALEVARGGLWLLGTYLCLTAVLLGLARLDPTGWTGRLAAVWTPEKLRQLAGMGTLALAGAVGTVPTVAPPLPGANAVATIRALPLPATPEPAPRRHPVPPRPPAPEPAPIRAHEPDPVTTPSPAPPAQRTRRWVVQPGQSFWSEAEAVTDRPGGLAGPAELTRRVAACWLQLEQLDRSRLVRPGDFDLIEPGQVMERPPEEDCGRA